MKAKSKRDVLVWNNMQAEAFNVAAIFSFHVLTYVDAS